jgi:hypothetical protein
MYPPPWRWSNVGAWSRCDVTRKASTRLHVDLRRWGQPGEQRSRTVEQRVAGERELDPVRGAPQLVVV